METFRDLQTKRLTQEPELIIHLIAEDLKARFFFDTLRTVDLDDTYYQPDLCSVILVRLGYNLGDDDALDLYCDLATRYSQNLHHDRSLIQQNAWHVYKLLVEAKGG